jgi:hypothetical protein
MAIDYVVRVAVPEGLLDLFGNDAVFSSRLNNAISGNSSKELMADVYLVEFEDLADAEDCEHSLEQLFEEYFIKRNELIVAAVWIQQSINRLVTDVPLWQMKELLSLNEVDINMELFSLLIAEATKIEDNR